MHMSKIVNGPGRQKLCERHHSQRRMSSSPVHIFGLQIQRLQRNQIFPSQAGEIVQELLQRFVLSFFQLRKTVKRIKGTRFAGSRMMRARGIQSVRSPMIRWPTMSNALQVSLPSLLRTQLSGSPRNSASRVAGVRVRSAIVSSRLNSVKVAMLYIDDGLVLRTQVETEETIVTFLLFAVKAFALDLRLSAKSAAKRGLPSIGPQ